jgi:hypothetical protein
MLENCVPSDLNVFNIKNEVKDFMNKEGNNFSEDEIKRRLLNLNLIEEKRKKKTLEMEEKNKLNQINQSLENPLLEKINNPNLNISLQNIKSIEQNNNFTKKNILNQSYDIKKETLSRSISPTNISSSQKIDSKILNPIKKKQTIKYKLSYCILKGNNSQLIEKCLEYRKDVWEKSILGYSKYCNLIWTPLRNNINYMDLQDLNQYVNHFEYNDIISNKKNLFLCLLKYCEKKNYNLFSFFPFTIIFEFKLEGLENQIEQFKNFFNNIKLYIDNDKNDNLKTKYNEIFNTYCYKKLGSNQTIKIPETHFNDFNYWIIKPVNLNRGMCIKIENEIEKIESEIKEIKEKSKIENLYDGKEKKCKRLLLQKYIEKPLLYQGRKFDIRLWVLLIGNKPNYVYIFKEGHLKASCLKYNLNSNDPYIHLTNYSIQKHNSNFSKIEIGNEIPFKDFQNELDNLNTGINFRKIIYPKICKIVRITAGACKDRINLMKRKNCFEIFGYDFMIDCNYNPFLIEINTNPGLEISSPLINMLLPRLIDDAFKLTIDVEFDYSKVYKNMSSSFHVDGYSNDENMFEKFTLL